MTESRSGSAVSAATGRPRPFFRYYGASNPLLDILPEYVCGRIDRGGTERVRLERALAEFLGTEEAIGLTQARFGIFLALANFLSPSKPKVILSPYTIYDVINVVIAAGGTPVFADVDESTCNIDFESARRLIDDETGAILVTHLHGLACTMSPFVALCENKKIPLIEDCAQAFGAIDDGKRAGTIGDAGIYSFSSKKHVNCLYGGCMTVNDAGILDACRRDLSPLRSESATKLLRRAAMSSLGNLANSELCFAPLTFPVLRFLAERRGETALPAVSLEHASRLRKELPERYRRQMTDYQASLVSRQLAGVDDRADERIAYAREYHAALGHLDGIKLAPLREDRSHVYLSFVLQVDDRLTFQRELMRQGCDVRLQSYVNLASSPTFAEYAADCPVAENVASRALLLPIHSGFGLAEIKRVAAVVRSLIR